MKKLILLVSVVSIISFSACSSDDDNKEEKETCVTCAAYDIQGTAVPAIDICKGENGNAFIQGIDSTVAYDTYISTLEQLTTCE